ncbi:MAG: thermonuclease family protein [Roseiflexaceae bacterium]
MSQDIFTNSRQPSASSGCCIIGFIVAIIAALLYPLKFIVVGLWRLGPHIIKYLYYFLAWPILAVEYAWRRGGGWRMIAVIFGVLFTLVYGAISIAGILAGASAGASPTIAITTAATSTPTRLITATTVADTPEASPVASPTPPPVPPTQTVAARASTTRISATDTAVTVPVATATNAPAATATDVPAATATDVPAPTAIAQTTDAPSVRSSAQTVDAAWVQVNVVRVADGDTITVKYNGVNTSVRLIGVDTPETVDPRKPVQCYGVEASNYTKSQLNKQTVYLEFDESQGITDRYDRLLAFVRRADGSLFNYDLIANGYAFEYTYQNNPYRYQSEFIAAAREARENGRGLWAASTCNGITGSASISTASGSTSSGQSQGGTIATAAPALTAADEAAPCQVNQIKGNRNSMIYHVPSGASYAKTKANVECFDSEAAAEAAGYRKAKR